MMWGLQCCSTMWTVLLFGLQFGELPALKLLKSEGDHRYTAAFRILVCAVLFFSQAQVFIRFDSCK